MKKCVYNVHCTYMWCRQCRERYPRPEDVKEDLDSLWVAERSDTVLGVIGIKNKDGKVLLHKYSEDTTEERTFLKG